MAQQYIDFAYVKQHASFERVIAGYNLKLLGSGSQRSLLCPFHRERKPSCKIDLERNIWHCFGCEAKGNVLEFVARLEGDEDDLRTAALKIAEICGIATAAPRERGARSERKPTGGARRARVARAWAGPEEPAHEANRGAGAAAGSDAGSASVRLTTADSRGDASTALANDNGAPTDAADAGAPVNPPLTFELKLDPAHPYLAERGLSAAIIRDFGLGHCARGVMAGRICIPIHDAAGQLVAYAGRWPGENVPEGEERYKLPKNFQKSRVLFNLHRAATGEHIVLVEGYWSAIRLHALGLPVAALMGWSASAEQTALLRDRAVRFVTLLLDGDDIGRRGRERVLPDLTNSFFVRAPLLPDGEKPDTLGEAELLKLLAFAIH